MQPEPSRPQSNERPNGLWRLAAPLAVVGATALSGCVTAPTETVQRAYVNPEPAVSSSAATRSRGYQRLREAVAEDPQTRDRILVVDPTDYSSSRQLLEGTRAQLTGMIAKWPQQPEKYILRDIMQPLSEKASKEDETLAPGNSGAYIRAQTGLSSDLSLQAIAGRTLANEHDNPRHKEFICVAIGERAQIATPDWLLLSNRFTQTPHTDFTDGFKKVLATSNAERTEVIKHEVGHCLGEIVHPRDTSALLRERAEEAKADVARVLLSIQFSKAVDSSPAEAFDPNLAIESKIQERRAMQVMAWGIDSPTNHDTTQALRLLQRDLKANPDMQQEIKGMTLTQIGDRAARYAERGSLLDYPHLAESGRDAKTRYAMTQQADADFEMQTRFVSGHMLVKGFNEVPETLTTQSALGIVQLAYAAENYLVQPSHSRLKQAMSGLRARFPEQMREADRLFAQEQKEFPPLQTDSAKAVSGAGYQSLAKTAQTNHRRGIMPG